MKARLCLVASIVLLAGQAMAEEQMAPPKSDPGLPAPPPAATEPAPAPAPQTEAMTPAPAPQKDAATPAPEPQKDAATPPPAPAPQQQAEVPAAIVVTELTEVDDNKKLVPPWAVPVDTVEEMDLYDKDGKKIGEVDAVLQDKNGEIKGVAIAYGGFLGFGEKGAIVTLDQVKLKDGNLVTEITEDQLSEQPAWNK